MPDGGDGTFINFMIGGRDDLTEDAARKMAGEWRRAVKQYPHAIFYLHLAGYDEDPREIWEIDDAARFVCRWAQLAGIHKPEDFPVPPDVIGVSNYLSFTLGFLAGCGAFGKEAKREALRNARPTLRN
jgi:hypothetical protein